MMTSRERVKLSITHKQPDRVPIDLGATGQTGIHASALYRLRKEYGLESHPIRIIEPFQMLGEVEDDLMRAIGVDVIGLWGKSNLFGVENIPSQPFTLFDGTPVLMPADFRYKIDDNSDILVYPQGDVNAAPSLRMPRDGSFFDNIDRSPPVDEDNLTPIEDYKDSFSILSENDLVYTRQKADRLFEETDLAIIGNLGGAGFGDAAVLPGPFLKNPKGIRKMDEWLMAHMLYPEYIHSVFEIQTNVMLKNLELYRQAVGEKIQIIWISGTDFGTQNNGFLSCDTFNEMYKPYYKQINDWVHKNTSWKTFYHTCGSVVDYLDDFVEMGMDILNPVQLSAKGMNATMLKEKYGTKLTFWGGGINTQHTLQNGSKKEIQDEVAARLDILSKDGGFVFSTIHNIVANVPSGNIKTMFDLVSKYNENGI